MKLLTTAARRAAASATWASLALALPALPGRAADDAAVPWAAVPGPLLPARWPVADAAGWTLRAAAANFEASDATPVRALSGDWGSYTPRAGRNAALQIAGLALSAARSRWELAATLRSDVVIDGSRGAFDVVRAYKQRQAPADGSAFDAEAQSRGAVWAGVRGARTWVVGELRESRPGAGHGLQLTAAVSLLSVRRVQRTDVAGRVAYSAAGGYAFDAQTWQQDSRRSAGGFGQAGATGSGVSADVGLLWQPGANSFVNLSLVDALSRLRVRQVPATQTTLSSATRSLDANGYLDYKPLATGRYSASDVTLQLARKLSVTAGGRWVDAPGEPLDGLLAGLRWERVGGVDLPSLWAALPLRAGPWPGLTLQADAETRFRSVGVGVAGAHGSLMLRSSAASVGQARALGWQASLAWPF